MVTKRFTALRLPPEPVRAARPGVRAQAPAGPQERAAVPAGVSCTACQDAAKPCPACAAAAGSVGAVPAGRVGAAPPLVVGPVGEPAEREAERIAKRVPFMDIPRPLPVHHRVGAGHPESAGGSGPALPEPVHEVLGSGGQPLDPVARAFMEPRLGRDLGQVRVHTDARAAASARALDAAAYTVGRDIVFGAGLYAPATGRGRHLLAHELTHVAQQGGGAPAVIQRTTLSDYAANAALPDPASSLTDAEISATDEYAFISTYSRPGTSGPYASQAEALLACRLVVRSIRELQASLSTDRLPEYIDRAKAQLGVLGASAGLVGNLNWVPFSTSAAVNNPAALPTEFGRWVLAGGPEPSAVSGSINCWEMVLFSAYRGGYLTFARIQAIYNLAVANVRAGTTRSVGDTVETELRAGAVNLFDPANPDSPAPLPGDMVIFNTAATHAAIALGTKTASGEHEVLSLWNQPNAVSQVQRTTIEALLAAAGAGARPVRFWSARWG